MECPKCKTDWPEDCEQAIAVELYGKCASCKRFDSDLDFSEIQKIQKDRDYNPLNTTGG